MRMLAVATRITLACALAAVAARPAFAQDAGILGSDQLHVVPPTFGGVVRAAAVQTNPRFMDNAYNLAVMLDSIEQAALGGAQLVVFPELSLTGYKFLSTAEALAYAEEVPGPSTDAVSEQAARLGVYVAFGLVERDGRDAYDTVAFVGPEGFIGKYRKIHQGFRSEALLFTRGQEVPPVFATSIGRIGLGNCYDGAFPETARILAAQGADILLFPYNESGQLWRDYVRSRATENDVYVIAAARIGGERFSSFNGLSLIAAPGFRTLAEASNSREEIIFADLDLAALPAERLANRRPELYGVLDAFLPPQILSTDVTPVAHVAGSAQHVDVTVLTASLPTGGVLVTAEVVDQAGLPVAWAEGALENNRARLTFALASDLPAGDLSIRVTMASDPVQVVELPYTIKAQHKPVVVGALPVGPGAPNKGSIYVSFDTNVCSAAKVPVLLASATTSTTLYGSVNTAGTDNRLTINYSGLAYERAYTVTIPAGSVTSVQDQSPNDAIQFSFVVQPSPLSVKVAAVQMTPRPLDVAYNLGLMLAKLDEAAGSGAKLVVMPELAITGGRFASRDETQVFAEPISGPSVAQMIDKARSLNVYAAFGMLEVTPGFCGRGRCEDAPGRPEDLFSTFVLVGPEGLVGTYRKAHLSPEADGFVEPGDQPFGVFATAIGPVGLAMGHDYFYPEVARSLALRGALIIASGDAGVGTVWTELARSRASENKVYVVAANQVGSDGDKLYGGLSVIAGSLRKVFAQASATTEATIYADLNLYDIQKRRSEYIDRASAKVRGTDYYLDRRAELYHGLAWSHEQAYLAPVHHGFVVGDAENAELEDGGELLAP